MLTHALVQLPSLAIAGFLLAPRGRGGADRFAPSALLVALFAAAIWMLPRMLDAALENPVVGVLKCVTIPLLVGLPLGWSWPRLSGVTRAFVWSNAVSMLVTLGWLYKAAPVRVCNYYLVAEQDQVGAAYLVLAVVIGVGWLPRLFLRAAPIPATAPESSPHGLQPVPTRG
ncbi:MAG: hypothetical protein AAF430_01110 [Myxococcota bacterium]